MRVGIGHDLHRLEPGGPLRLGGIDIPHDRRLVGHSDADALLHAVTDAILGAAGLGDIGEMFPDTDPENLGRDSAQMLLLAAQQVAAAGFTLGNVDCTVHAQRPSLRPHKDAIRRRLGEILTLDADLINVKAKTGEGVGVVGTAAAIAADCVVVLQRLSP